MSQDEFNACRAFIYDRTGIYFQDNKKYLLEGRLGKRVQALNLHNFTQYLNLLKNGAARDEMRWFYDTITINETFFFRNEPQFNALEEKLIPEILSKKGNGRNKLRVWSSASSSGEEAHTIGMIYLEKLKPKYPGLEIEIVGTDINASVVETARSGVYREYSVRNMPKHYLTKYFTQSDGRYVVRDDVRRLVRFENMNLFDKQRMRAMSSFDIVFCCNVLIYFDTKSKIQVVSQLYDSLNRGGYLFVGYAESLHGLSTAFELVNFPKTVAYKKG
ncbi:MAG: protein-glutamate O-methyltransferase CheR [Ignavibacteriae bacterium]|nr:protein-glutamate O-methyltransferase CheR [Ignavibacteriota bacterium]